MPLLFVDMSLQLPKGAPPLGIHFREILLPPWGYLLKAKHYHILKHKLFEWALFPRVKWNYFDHPYHSKLFIGTPTPKVGTHLGVCGFIPSHSPIVSGI
jgi:hypothetical protein